MRPLGLEKGSLGDEHPLLMEAAGLLLTRLRGMPDALTSVDGASVWLHHTEIAHRAGDLADHLVTAIGAADAARYASALSVLRTAMEHECVEELLLLANRYREVLSPVDDTTYERLLQEFRTGTGDWVEFVTRFERQGKGVAIERMAHFVKDDAGNIVEQLSPYYPVIEDHDAFLGPPDAQDLLAEPFSDPERLRDWARRNRGLHQSYLRWAAIRDNLLLNGCIEPGEDHRLDVHYRFLSAFTHATGSGYKALERRRGHVGFGRSKDHLLGELVLLYVCAFGIRELRAFAGFTETRPKIYISDSDAMLEEVDEVASMIGYLWYPGIGGPTPYDHYEEANRRAFARGTASYPLTGPRPKQIAPEEVTYYRDPLDRLAHLHTGAREMTTGYSYGPLWG